ncbi:alpha/beta hydrolase [Methyloferula stellata]|uniref:alpha/beta hydrolase n=1 Tax=Methyloferula stellata TaxID=876270 RepID=UPI00038105A7|nr:alpha/beta hydrolase [Methyloferula stellata]
MNGQDPQFEIAAKSSLPQFIRVGKAPSERRIAYLSRTARKGRKKRPGVIWLGGLKSDMRSLKASALDAWAEEQGRAFLRFDYSGHGDSDGRFEDATIGDWLEESLAVLRSQSSGPQILVGSSMGGWLALLVARALQTAGDEKRLAGLVLIAPAVDFTERLIWARLSPEAKADMETKGVWLRQSAYSAEPYPITRKLIEEGRKHLLFDSIIRTYCPVHILQGLKDEDVPPSHAMALVEHLVGDEVVLTSIKDGDHRLSRPEDIARLIAAIEAIA